MRIVLLTTIGIIGVMGMTASIGMAQLPSGSSE